MKNILRDKNTNKQEANEPEMNRKYALESYVRPHNMKVLKYRSRYFLKQGKVLLDYYNLNNYVFHGVKKNIIRDISWERSSFFNSYLQLFLTGIYSRKHAFLYSSR